jgi:hypothetical protein
MFEDHDIPAAASANPAMSTAAPSMLQPVPRTLHMASDPWAPLDPHVANVADNKPLKRGKTWREPKLPTSLLPVSVVKQVRVGLPKVTNFNTPCFGCSQKVFAALRMKAASQRLHKDTADDQQQDNALASEDVAASMQDWHAQDDAPFHEELDSDDEAALTPLPPLNAVDAQVPSHQDEQTDLVIDDMHSFQARCRSYMYCAPDFVLPPPFLPCSSEPIAGTASPRAGRDSLIRCARRLRPLHFPNLGCSLISRFEFENGRISWTRF